MITISLIGRENVGKSMLFNKIIKEKKSIVSKLKGFTTDLNYSNFFFKKKKILLIDTGGINFKKNYKIQKFSKIFLKTKYAIKKSTLLFFVIDGKKGITFQDKEISNYLRKKFNKKIILIINKIDIISNKQKFLSNYYELGFKKIFFISALNGNGINYLLNNILKKNFFLINKKNKYSKKNKKKKNLNFAKIIFIGQPNVGKSTLINKIIKKKKLITSKVPGTTRDNIILNKKFNKKKIILIDTAGIKKKKKQIDKITFIPTKKNIKNSNIAFLIIDASKKRISRQDLRLSHILLQFKIYIIIVVNKWDTISNFEKKIFKKEIKLKFKFFPFLKIYYISARFGIGIKKLLISINKIHNILNTKIKNSILNKILKNAILKNPFHIISNKKIKKIKLKYIHIGGLNPIKLIIHGNGTKNINKNYKKYLINYFKKKIKISGNSLNIYFKDKLNSYKKNKFFL